MRQSQPAFANVRPGVLYHSTPGHFHGLGVRRSLMINSVVQLNCLG
jgi:hypothetical protein